MPRGYNGDCRDCVYYDSEFHRVHNSEYDYRCDRCKEYFNDRYGSTCHLFVDKEDIRQQRIAEEYKDRDIEIFIGTALGGGVDSSENTSLFQQRKASMGNVVSSCVIIGFIFVCAIYAALSILLPAVKNIFFYDLPEGYKNPNNKVVEQIK